MATTNEHLCDVVTGQKAAERSVPAVLSTEQEKLLASPKLDLAAHLPTLVFLFDAAVTELKIINHQLQALSREDISALRADPAFTASHPPRQGS